VRALVKICGITTEDDALMAVEAGAGAVGLVFWEGSLRRVARATARQISRALPPAVWRVGVFVDAPEAELISCVEEVGLDIVQLHGERTPGPGPRLRSKVWMAVPVDSTFLPQEALRFEGTVDGILLDTKTERPGGSGRSFDWDLVREVRRSASFLVLAGGLGASNVGAAIRAVHPDVVDVASGVESSPGKKDRSKVIAFIEAVRREGD
jgi:phosphoribosylanthranilate isomerase